MLEHLDREVIRANPKPFFGYCDNTNLHRLLWDLGLVSYHGGAVMVQFGGPGRVQADTERSLRQALLERGERHLEEPGLTTDEEQCDWQDAATFAIEPQLTPAVPWSWHGAQHAVTGPLWGGCLEILDLHLHLQDRRYLPHPSGCRVPSCSSRPARSSRPPLMYVEHSAAWAISGCSSASAP